MKKLLAELLGFASIGLIGCGLWMMYRPIAFVFVGLVVLGFAHLLAKGK
jgi:hypothetical protein